MFAWTRAWVSFAGVACLAVACNRPEPSEEKPPPELAPAAEPPAEPAAAEPPAVEEEVAAPERSATRVLMKGHFTRASDARDALIKGDVDTAKADMKWLAEHKHGDDLEEDLRPLLAAMQTSAAEFAKGTTLRDVGVSLALTLNRCGDCHTKAGAEPTFAVSPLPEGKDPKAHMQRHLWAAERMWEGLVTNNAETFNSGAAILSESPLHAEALIPGEHKQTVAKLVEHLHQLAAKAKATEDRAERAEVYGNFLATCSTCHRLLGRGPQTAAPAATQ